MGDELTGKIIDTAIELHRVLAPVMFQSIHEEALCVEWLRREITFQRQVELDVDYKGHIIKGQRIDLLVAGEVIVELKAVASLPEVAVAQTLSYFKVTGLKRALLINFGERKLVNGIKRISL